MQSMLTWVPLSQELHKQTTDTYVSPMTPAPIPPPTPKVSS